ncbi:zinc-ribbon domain containing protein [uncultured Gimesia sp.]|uniref:zinc-ribbon domain containing protein n=1 Tax=uncultured Gimesia sp. TaxID=1678688 RepID=UPI00261E5D15|nr:zinc-ribbon domain containing protein [uncultured Gimesia sp.]
MDNIFGEVNSRGMSQSFFNGFFDLDHDSAIRADITHQNYSVCPRYWYVDAKAHCFQCKALYWFNADEQKIWYEQYRFYVHSSPKECLKCRKHNRRKKELRQEYDREIKTVLESRDLDLKKQMAELIDLLCSFGIDLPDRMHENRRTLAKQIATNTPSNDR